MTVRLMIAAAATLSIASASFAADPAKNEIRDDSAKTPPAELVMASADVKSPAPVAAAQQAPAPVKRRAGRVTTCRCGDPQPAQPDEDQ